MQIRHLRKAWWDGAKDDVEGFGLRGCAGSEQLEKEKSRELQLTPMALID